MRAATAIVLLGMVPVFAGGCSDDTYLIVTVDKRPAVHEAAKLKVTLSNAGSMRTDDLDLGENAFPVTFSLTAPGRSGELGISIDALDTNGALVGQGIGQASLADPSASVTLDSADFVVNTDYPNNQFLSNDFEANGLQLAAITNGTWMAVYRDECTTCDIYGRRFDTTGLPVTSTLAAGTNAFKVTTTLTTSGAIPAISASGATTLVFWDFFDTVGSAQGVACRAINESGGGNPAQLTISTDSADVVTSTAIGNGNFAVTWQMFQSTAPAMEVVRSIIVKPDCTTLTPTPITVSPNVQTLGHRRSHVAANGTGLLYVWVSDDSVKARPATNAGVLTGMEQTPVLKTASMQVDHVRVVPYGTGFAIGVRWSAMDGTSPGKIEVYKTDVNGVVQGTPTLITDKSGSDFASDKSFGMAARSDNALIVAWHSCPTGPGSCDVIGRMMRPTGVPVGDEFVIPTSTGSDQVNPSVIALDNINPPAFVASWNDSSGLDPDRSGSAVRARIIYPPYDDARAVIGATCGASAPGAPNCGPGLACATGSDQVQRCYQTCTPPTCPGGGTCSTVDGSTSACTF